MTALSAQGAAASETLAARIRRGFAEVGCTVEGLPDDLTPDQAVEFLEEFLRKLDAVTA